MGTTSSLDILPLLREAYPVLRCNSTDRGKDNPGVQPLLLHCTNVIKENTARGEKMDTRKAWAIFRCLVVGEPYEGNGNDEPSSESGLRRAVLAACPPWASRTPSHEPWGWDALNDLCLKGDGASIRYLLQAQNTPSVQALMEHRFDFTIESGLSHVPDTTMRCNAMGLLLVGAVWRTKSAGWREAVAALIDAGVDINAPVGLEMGPAIEYTEHPEALTYMVSRGADLRRPNHEGRMAISGLFGKCHRQHACKMIDACLEMATQHPEVAEQLRDAWPELLLAWGKWLANSKASLKEATTFLKSAQGLSDFLGLPLGSNRPGQPNLFAYCARDQLSDTKDISHRFYCLQDFPAWPELTTSLSIKHAWAGEIEPGIPDGAWGLMVATMKKTFDKSTFPRGQVDAFMAGKGDIFWEGYARLLERTSQTPGAWRSIPVLEPLIPKRMLRDMARTAMVGFLTIEEGERPSPYGFAPAKALTQMSTKWLHRMLKGGEVDGEMCNLALRMHIRRGMNSQTAQEAFSHFTNHHPELADFPALLNSLKGSADAFDRERLTQAQGQLISAQTCVAPAVRSTPRL